VEVLLGDEWFSLPGPPTVPLLCDTVSASLHHGSLFYFFGGFLAFHCKLAALLNVCTQSHIKSKQTSPEDQKLWTKSTLFAHKHCPVRFGRRLLMHERKSWPCQKIFAHLPLTRSWVHVADLPPRFSPMALVPVSAEELIAVGWYLVPSLEGKLRLFKATLKSKEL